MADKLETTAKADGAGLEQGDKGDKNPSLNLVDIKADNPTKAPDATSGKAQEDSAMKSLPSVEIVDAHPVNDSPMKAENRNSMNEKDIPRFGGAGNWAALEAYTLATDKPESLKEQNRMAFDGKEKPRYEGTGNW